MIKIGYDLLMALRRNYGQPLRQFMLRRAAVMVVATTLMLVASFIGFGLMPMADQVAKDQFDHTAISVRAELDAVFPPTVRLLQISHGWLAGRSPDLTSPEGFNQFFKPVLQSSPAITSVVAGTSSGQGWLLLQKPGGGWRNRMTDVPRWGSQRHLLFDESPGGEVSRSWGDQNYDPRTRPWFTGARELSQPLGVHWTAPYTFFTTGDPGITVSSATQLDDGREFVLGFDLKLRDLSTYTQAVQVGKHGLALVLTEDERLLALPARPDTVTQAQWINQVLQPAGKLGLPALNAALDLWRAGQQKSTDVLGFQSQGTRWLASVRPYALGHEKLWVMVLAPAADFAIDWQPIALALLASLMVVFCLAWWLTHSGTARMLRPLEILADNSRRIGVLDFGFQPEVRSRILEIQQLAASQQIMLATLRENQQELDARAEELSRQVAALKSTETRLQQKSDMLQTMVDNFPGGVSVANAELQMVAFNDQFKTLLDLSDDLLNRPVLMFEDLIRYNAERGDYGPGDVQAIVAERVIPAREFKPHRLERTLPNGNVVEIRGTPLPQGGMVTLYIDITASKQHQLELEHLAHFDALTGLPNRVLLADRLRQGMAQVGRHGHQLAVAYLDLDGFKLVNDSMGHEVGDQLLVALTARMRHSLREGDTLARLGGDEFVAVFTDVSGLAECVPMLERLLAAVSSPQWFLGREVQVSASLGVVMFTQYSEVDADQLLRQADQAMYQAKQSGKNRYHVFDAEHDRTLRGQFEGLKRIEQALVREEFVLYYQPKVNMRTGQVVGVEALIRWQHPQQGLLAPALFLPLIEDDPIAIRVGEWVITTALAQMAAWKTAGLHLEVSVNVGARQLQQNGFVAFLRQALQHQALVDAADLQIEILETSALQDTARVTEVMLQCSSLGVHFALDDFGTGYSSLTYLKRLPVSQLKIDQSFVRDMLDDPDDLSILVGVLDLAASFHRQAIAEGVETVEHGHMLLQLGCELAQGYGIARPMPSAQVMSWVAVWKPGESWASAKTLPRADLPLLFAQVEQRAWGNVLNGYLFEGGLTPPSVDVHQCQLGKWLDSGGLKRYAHVAAAQLLHDLHHQVYQLAAHLCQLKAQGDMQVVLAQWPALLQLRQALMTELQDLCQACET
jgi:diguanylate cyclase (GGDEF)-like protein